MWLIEHAACRPTKIDVAGTTVTVARGQISVSYRSLCEAWKWNLGSVRAFIDRMKTDTLIDTATDTGRMLITVCNYDVYQAPGVRSNTADNLANNTASTQQRHTKERRKERKESSKREATPPAHGAMSDAGNSNAVLDKNSDEIQDEAAASNLPAPIAAKVVPIRHNPHFQQFWEIYPRKVSKGHALVACNRAIQVEPPESIIAALWVYPFTRDKSKLPYPATWLDGERWADDMQAQSDATECQDRPPPPRAGSRDWMLKTETDDQNHRTQPDDSGVGMTIDVGGYR